MAGKSDFFENAILKLIFENSLIPGVGHTGAVVGTGLPASTTPGKLWIGLHTTQFTDLIGETAGTNQNSAEVRYSTYSRVGVERRRSENGAEGWIVTGNQVKPGQPITFPPVTAVTGTQTVAYFSIGTEPTGDGQILYFGTVSPNITLAVGITPQLTVATTITED